MIIAGICTHREGVVEGGRVHLSSFSLYPLLKFRGGGGIMRRSSMVKPGIKNWPGMCGLGILSKDLMSIRTHNPSTVSLRC